MQWTRSFYVRSRPLQGTGSCPASPVAAEAANTET